MISVVMRTVKTVRSTIWDEILRDGFLRKLSYFVIGVDKFPKKVDFCPSKHLTDAGTSYQYHDGNLLNTPFY